MKYILEIKNLSVKAGDKLILDNISFKVATGQTVLILGPNGSGKSTLANVIMGNPNYQIISGKIIFAGTDISQAKPEQRAALGLFLSFQEPRVISGLELFPFLFDAHKNLRQAQKRQSPSVFSFKTKIDKELANLKVKEDWSKRYLNEGFSGGEKKKSELLQLALSNPRLALLDEIDSGLDLDALEIAISAISRYKKASKTLILISHSKQIWQELKPDLVLLLSSGRLVKTGGQKLAEEIALSGFSKII